MHFQKVELDEVEIVGIGVGEMYFLVKKKSWMGFERPQWFCHVENYWKRLGRKNSSYLSIAIPCPFLYM
jgi:hypothetical protein